MKFWWKDGFICVIWCQISILNFLFWGFLHHYCVGWSLHIYGARGLSCGHHGRSETDGYLGGAWERRMSSYIPTHVHFFTSNYRIFNFLRQFYVSHFNKYFKLLLRFVIALAESYDSLVYHFVRSRCVRFHFSIII